MVSGDGEDDCHEGVLEDGIHEQQVLVRSCVVVALSRENTLFAQLRECHGPC